MDCSTPNGFQTHVKECAQYSDCGVHPKSKGDIGRTVDAQKGKCREGMQENAVRMDVTVV